MRLLLANHTSQISGAELSLLDLIGGLPDFIEPLLACPPGLLADAAAALDIPVEPIPGTAGSLRLHPVHTTRAMAELAAAGTAIRVAAARHEALLVHANSIRTGVAIGLSRPQAARLVHVRDTLPPGRVSTATLRMIAAAATSVVANSAYTAASVRAAAPGANLEVVHNPVDLSRFDPAKIDRVHARARLAEVRPRALLLGVVAQLTPWKGQDTAIEALALLRREGVDAHLLLIGSAKFVADSTRFDNSAYVEQLHARVAELGLEDRVSWLGERSDVPELIAALDALLLPSWSEPFGRVVIEAMALRVPVIATSIGGPPEIISDGREGFLVPPREPRAWAEAVSRLAADPRLGRRLGIAGRERVEGAFTLEHHVRRMMLAYERALGRFAAEST